MDSDRHAPQPWYRTERRRNAQQGLETTITVTEQTLHEKVGKLRKRFRTRKLLPLLSAWYVAVVQERQGNPELVEHTLADRLGGAMRTLAEYRDALPRTARASDVQLRDTLCELVDTKTAQTLVPERSDAPMLTYVGFQRSLIVACASQLRRKYTDKRVGLPTLLGASDSSIYVLRHGKTPAYLPPLGAMERGIITLPGKFATAHLLDTLCALYIEAIVRRHPKSWENMLQHNRGVYPLSDERKRMRAQIGKRDPGTVLREALTEIVDRETVNALMPARHEAPHRTLRGFEQLLLSTAYGQLKSYRLVAERFGTYTQQVIRRACGKIRTYAALPREFLSIKDFLACYSAYAVQDDRYASTAHRLCTPLPLLKRRAARGRELMDEGVNFPAYVRRTIYDSEDLLARRATIQQARERYLLAVGDLHHTKSAAAHVIGLSPHNFIVQYNRLKKSKPLKT